MVKARWPWWPCRPPTSIGWDRGSIAVELGPGFTNGLPRPFVDSKNCQGRQGGNRKMSQERISGHHIIDDATAARVCGELKGQSDFR
eukprot:scaffold88965_cov47-Attheya_sp.AAC.4